MHPHTLTHMYPPPCSLPSQSLFLPLHAPYPSILSSLKPPHWPSPSNRMIIWHNVTPPDAWWGLQVSFLPLDAGGWCLGLKRKEKWSRDHEYICRREKGISRSYRYMAGVHRLNLSCVPGGLFPSFCSSSGRSSLFSLSAFLHMVPIQSICTVKGVQKYCTLHTYITLCGKETGMWWGSLSRYWQDPARLLGASDTQAGRERNTKMAAVCSVCLHTAMSDVSTADV